MPRSAVGRLGMSGGLFSYDRRPEQGPCSCPVAMQDYPHSLEDHRRESCGGSSRPDPCGGCYDCVCAQWAYYERLRA